MDIRISIDLKDKTYGFSDLLDGRELNDQTKQEIIDLIKEDIGYVFDQQIEVEQLNLCGVVKPLIDKKVISFDDYLEKFYIENGLNYQSKITGKIVDIDEPKKRYDWYCKYN